MDRRVGRRNDGVVELDWRHLGDGPPVLVHSLDIVGVDPARQQPNADEATLQSDAFAHARFFSRFMAMLWVPQERKVRDVPSSHATALTVH